MKVFQIEPSIMQYRVPVFNIISDSVDYTVGYVEDDKSISLCRFKKLKLETVKVGPLLFLSKSSKIILNQYDVVITSPNLRFWDSIPLGLFKTKFKTIGWNIGIRASYTVNYDANRKHNFLDSIYGFLLFKFDALIFYMSESKKFWKGRKMDNVFVAPNTTEVADIEFIPDIKKDILFVGSLYKGKGLDKLVYSFKEAISAVESNVILHVVGGGAEREAIEALVRSIGLQDRVIFHGPIYDEIVLATIFQKSIICVSPTQAGLSVPKSMGYGVPFITRRDAITGGEIYHISNQVNGVLYDDDQELTHILIDTMNNPSKYIEMGLNAKTYYNNNATPKHMADAAIEAIKFVLK